MLQNFDILKQPDHWFEISQKQKFLFIIMLILVKKKSPHNREDYSLISWINLLEWQIVRRTLASGLLCWWEW